MRAALLRVASPFTKLWRASHFERNQKLDQTLITSLRDGKKIPSWRQLRYLAKFYTEREVLVTRLASLLLIVSLAVLGFSLYKTYVKIMPAVGGEYVEAVVGSPTYINPLFSQTSSVDQDLTRLVFSSLVNFDGNGALTPDLADSFTIDDKQTTYTFILKPDLRWHDGEPLTADDVVFTVQSIKDVNFKSPLYSAFRNVQVRSDDERTVSFTLSEPFSPFLSLLTFGILPAHLWSDIDPLHASLAELNLKPIGSGPYLFASLSKDKKGNIREYLFERFEDYHQTGPFLKQITFKFYSSLDEAQAALVDGNVDGLGLVASSINNQPAAGNQNVHQLDLPQYTALFFNQGANAALADKNVRQALALATSRKQIVAATFGANAEPIDDPLLSFFGQNIEKPPEMIFDPAQAAALLDASGWRKTDGDNIATSTQANIQLGLPESASAPYVRQKKIKRDNKEELVNLEIKLTTVQKDENIQVAEKIRELWQGVGVKVNVEIVDLSRVQRDVIKPRAYEVLLFGQILGRDPDPYPFWHSSQANDPGLNLALYNNKEADKLLEEARRTTDPDKRARDYLEFEKKLNADIPAIFLYSLKYSYLLPNNIQGVKAVKINQTSDRFSTINEWYVKTQKRLHFR